AQLSSAAALAIRARTTCPVAEDVERARVRERTVVRTWTLRGTYHQAATEDLGWLLSVLGPVFVAGGARRRDPLGLDELVDGAARDPRCARRAWPR
ncbi:MAG: DNA glycosylase AlkZ-like family protein, partial [Egibacteraceae bacterium]